MGFLDAVVPRAFLTFSKRFSKSCFFSLTDSGLLGVFFAKIKYTSFLAYVESREYFYKLW